MKKILCIVVLIVIGFPQAMCAGDAAGISALEAEVTSVKKAAVDQAEKIQALEKKVSSQRESVSGNKSSSGAEEGRLQGSDVPDKTGRGHGAPDQKYID